MPHVGSDLGVFDPSPFGPSIHMLAIYMHLGDDLGLQPHGPYVRRLKRVLDAAFWQGSGVNVVSVMLQSRNGGWIVCYAILRVSPAAGGFRDTAVTARRAFQAVRSAFKLDLAQSIKVRATDLREAAWCSARIQNPLEEAAFDAKHPEAVIESPSRVRGRSSGRAASRAVRAKGSPGNRGIQE